MATVRPWRSYWLTKATNWCYFDAISGTKVVHNGTTLVMGTNNANPTLATYYIGIKFDSHTAPSWVTSGPVATKDMVMRTVIAQIVTLSGGLSGKIFIGQATGAWDSSSTAAQMRAVVPGGWAPVSGVLSKYGVPVAWYAGNALPTNGFIIKIADGNSTRKGGVITLLADPAPMMSHHYQYTPTLATRSDATARATLSSDVTSILAMKKEYRKFALSATVKIEDRLPAGADITLAITEDSSGMVFTRKMAWPESYKPDTPSSGGITVSVVNESNIDNAKGMVIESTASVVAQDGTTTELIKTSQYVGDITHNGNGTVSLELRSMLASALNSRIMDFSTYEDPTVYYLDERPIYILTDILLNTAGLLYKQIRYNDLVYLARRFAGTWSVLRYTQTVSPAPPWRSLVDKVVSDIIEEIGINYNLAVSQTADGCISLWHPAVYRKSMRVWTIAESDCVAGGYKVIKRGMETQYGSIKVWDDGGSAGGAPASVTGQIPNYLPDAPAYIERIKEFNAYGQNFTDYGSAKAALARQLSQRLSGRMWKCTLTVGMKGLPVDVGDVVKLTGSGLSDTTRFLVIGTSPNFITGRVKIEGVHYPDILSISNTFEDDGLAGEWRWMDETGSLDSQNMAHDGTDAAPGTCIFSTDTYEHWQGVMWGAGYAEWSTALISSSKHDVIDICTMVADILNCAVTNYASWGDAKYLPIMVMRKASGNEAFAVGWYRPGYGGAGVEPVMNKMFIAHIVDYTAASFSFTAAAYAPAGTVGRESGTSDIPAAIALQWDDSGTAKLYVNRQLLASGSFSKTGWTSVRILTQADVKIGCVRHLQTDDEITELQQLQGLNGLDPYQP